MNIKTLSDKELVQLIDKAIEGFMGDFHQLEAAIGVLMAGRRMGWKPLLLIHDRKTIKKYEKILNVTFKEILPEVGDKADKSIAWVAVQKVTSFWKAVKGEISGIKSSQVN